MARIRSIKPEFWSDEKLAPLPPLVRLVFLGLISMADDAGRLVDNVKGIDGMLFPETDDTSRDALDTLASMGRIIRYTAASGQRLIQVAGWDKHQKVDKPAKYVLTAPPAGDSRDTLATPSRDSRAPILDHGSRINDQGPGTEGGADAPSEPGQVVDLTQHRARRRASPAEEGSSDRPSRPVKPKEVPRPDDWGPNAKHREYAREHHLDLAEVAADFCDWHDANGRWRVDWDKAFSNWLRRQAAMRPVTRRAAGAETDFDVTKEVFE